MISNSIVIPNIMQKKERIYEVIRLAQTEATSDNACMTVNQKNAAITLLWLTLPLLILAGDYWLNKRDQPAGEIEAAAPPPAITMTTESSGRETPAPATFVLAQIDLDQMLYVSSGEVADGPSGNGQAEFLADFYIDRQPVTLAEYVLFLNDLGRLTWDCGGYDCLEMPGAVEYVRAGMTFEAGQYRVAPDFAARPITEVDRRAAQAYCRWAGKRLPTPAEWQQAMWNFSSVESGPNLDWNPYWRLRCAYTHSD